MLLDYTYNESLEDLAKIYAGGNVVSVLTCTKVKAFNHPNQILPARQAYTGVSFKKSLVLAEHFAAPIYVFSAKYGLINLDKRIQDYSVSFLNNNKVGTVSDVTLAQQVSTIQDKWIIVYGTKCYADKIQKVSPNTRVVCPFYGLRPVLRVLKLNRYLSLLKEL